MPSFYGLASNSSKIINVFKLLQQIFSYFNHTFIPYFFTTVACLFVNYFFKIFLKIKNPSPSTVCRFEEPADFRIKVLE
jgi:hypothetical protein